MPARETDEHQPPERADDRHVLAPAARDAAMYLRRTVMDTHVAHDLGAIFARARELDPSAVRPEMVAEAERLTEARPQAASAETADDAIVLAPFASALRAEIITDALAHRPGPPPPLRRARLGVWLGLFASAAAAVLLVYTISPEFARKDSGAPSGVEANADGAGLRGHGSARQADPPAPPMAPVWRDTQLFDAPPQAVEASPAIAPSRPPEAVPEPRRAPIVRPRKAQGQSLEVTLEDEAQALWQAGDLSASEAKYRQIVRIAGRSQRAEFAYGDLFALTRQLRGSAGQVAMWREYLRAFPRGQFADDAHAGLCQRGSADETTACWREYLELHPHGAHRPQADAALARSPAPEAQP